MNLDEIKSGATRYIKSIAMDLVVVLVAIAYILYQMVTLKTNALNPLVLIAEAFVGIVCGVVIKQALGENGFSKGYNSDFWKSEEEKYNQACNTANSYMERVDNFYLFEEIDRKRNYRRSHLQGARLKYDQWFDYDGNFIGTKEMIKELDFFQKYTLKKCVKVKIYVLNLFSEYETTTDQDTKKEMTDKKQRARNITKNTLSATGIAMVGVYFVPLFNNWSWASLISSTMQVALWILFGIIQMYTNYNFVVQDKVAILRRKKELIKRFTVQCEQGLYIRSPYDLVADKVVEKPREIKVEHPIVAVEQ